MQLLLVLTYIFDCSHVRFVPSLDFYHEVVFHVLVLRRRRRKHSVMMNIWPSSFYKDSLATKSTLSHRSEAEWHRTWMENAKWLTLTQPVILLTYQKFGLAELWSIFVPHFSGYLTGNAQQATRVNDRTKKYTLCNTEVKVCCMRCITMQQHAAWLSIDCIASHPPVKQWVKLCG